MWKKYFKVVINRTKWSDKLLGLVARADPGVIDLHIPLPLSVGDQSRQAADLRFDLSEYYLFKNVSIRSEEHTS